MRIQTKYLEDRWVEKNSRYKFCLLEAINMIDASRPSYHGPRSETIAKSAIKTSAEIGFILRRMLAQTRAW